MKSNKRAIRAVLAVEIVLIVFTLFLAGWWMGVSHPLFERLATREADVPGLDSAFSPQGICALENESGPAAVYDYAVSGYLSGEPSRVYLVGKGQAEKYVTFTKGGAPVKTHFGGIAASADSLYLASGKEIARVPLETVASAKSGSAVEIAESYATGIQNSFCYLDGNMFYAGEFYRAGNYETDPSHEIAAGNHTNRAMVFAFPLDENGALSEAPMFAVSVCNEVQGFAVNGDKVVLSCSYALADSRLHVYQDPFGGEADSVFSLNGKEIPLYILEETSDPLIMPCMSEEILLSGDKVVILFESMTMKYRFFVNYRTTGIYSIPISKLSERGVSKALFGIPLR